MTTFIGLFTEDGLDQICETAAQAARETSDLRAMGCTVVRYASENEDDIFAIDDMMRGGVSFRRAVKQIKN